MAMSLHRDISLTLLSFMILFAAGALTVKQIEEDSKENDPKHIVIDEVTGAMILPLFIQGGVYGTAAIFIVYRIFDIFKPPPIKLIEKLPPPWGIMLDDIIAAIYAIAVVRVFIPA